MRHYPAGGRLRFCGQSTAEACFYLFWLAQFLKRWFLVTLASERLGSEVHGLSGLASDVVLEPDGSMSLHFYLIFGLKISHLEKFLQ